MDAPLRLAGTVVVNGERELSEAGQLADRQTSLLDKDHKRTLTAMRLNYEHQLAAKGHQRDGARETAERCREERDKARQDLMLSLAAAKRGAGREAARLVDERDAARAEAQRLHGDCEATSQASAQLADKHEQARILAQREATELTHNQDEFIVELLDDSERQLAAVARERDAAQDRIDGLALQLAKTDADAERVAEALAGAELTVVN